MVYGDPQPENIIIDTLRTKQLTMIDFTDVTLGDQLRDCGIFLQQLNFMGRDNYTSTDLRALRTCFIETYFGRARADMSDDEYQRINLYQAWNALRGFEYFFYQDIRREESYGLLEDAWLYLNCARERRRQLSIYL